MAEKILPDSKPTNVNPAVATATAKQQLYNAPRPLYRSRPHRRGRRSCFCYCCLWIIFILLLSTILAAVAGGVLYLLYRPHRPTFSISSLQISRFNLTNSSNQLAAGFNLTVIARNPNKNIVFYYDVVSVTIYWKKFVVGGDGRIPAFVTEKKRSATLKAVVRVEEINGDLKSDLKEKRSLPLTIELDSKVKVKIGRRGAVCLPLNSSIKR